MKFLCPSCKAKYQIADEKVAGRSVRMKCRKCGFVIPLSEVPEAPESASPGSGAEPLLSVPKAPRAPSDLGADSNRPSPAAPASAAKAAPGLAKPGLPRPAPPEAKSSPRSTGVGAPPPPSASAKPKPAAPPRSSPNTSAAPASAPGQPRPGLGSLLAKPTAFPAKPGGLASSTPKPAASAGPKAAVATAPAEQSPAPAPAVTPPKPAVVPRNVEVSPALLAADEDDDDGNTKMISGGALAAAFGALVGSGGEPGAGAPASSDEWFVGINEVPVGPIRLAELRKRAILGAVTLDSMVWRDGLEAWRPLNTFPELVAVLEESFSNVRASRGPLAPPKLSDASAAAALSNGGAQAAVLSTAGAAGQSISDDLAAAGLPRARTPLAAWIAIVVALGFGLVLGFVLFSSQKAPEKVVQIVEVPAKSGQVPVELAPPPPEVAASAAVEADTTKPKAGSKSGSSKTSDPQGADKGGGLTGLKGLGGLTPAPGGPGGPTPGGATPSGGGQLDAGQIQATVGRYTGSVKRSCWQPALDSRDANAPTSARVLVTITVGPSGSVQNVSTSGEPRGYPGLAGCIAGRVRAWQFPATGGTTTVNVPFVFAAQ